MGGKIDAYVDVVSPYSWLAFKHLRKNRKVLKSHGVEVEFHPFFLGGVNVATGNKPPWTVPAKAKYGTFDRARAFAHFRAPHHPPPSFFPILSVLPNRALLVIKNHSDPAISSKLEPCLDALWTALWVPPYAEASKPEELRKVLAAVFGGGSEGEKVADGVLQEAGGEAAKAALKRNTERVVEMGGFGAPWLWVTNAEGKEEGFFGSDRFHYLWDYLGLPVRHVEIMPKIEGKKAKL